MIYTLYTLHDIYTEQNITLIGNCLSSVARK